MDPTDLSIIKILRGNSRTPFSAIAERLDMAESTIRKRIGNLEDRGIIKQYSLVVEPSKLGFENVAFVGVDAEPTRYLEVAKKLRDDAGIKCVSTTLGDHMFMLEVWTKNNEELQKLSERIRSYGGITRICPAIVKETLKGSYN